MCSIDPLYGSNGRHLKVSELTYNSEQGSSAVLLEEGLRVGRPVVRLGGVTTVHVLAPPLVVAALLLETVPAPLREGLPAVAALVPLAHGTVVSSLPALVADLDGLGGHELLALIVGLEADVDQPGLLDAGVDGCPPQTWSRVLQGADLLISRDLDEEELPLEGLQDLGLLQIEFLHVLEAAGVVLVPICIVPVTVEIFPVIAHPGQLGLGLPLSEVDLLQGLLEDLDLVLGHAHGKSPSQHTGSTVVGC